MEQVANAADKSAVERLDVPVVVGAGPAGLSVGFALSRVGVQAKIIDRGANIGHAWHTYYDTLRLNSPRVLSSLPGMTIDPGAGRFPSRIDFLLYLERYARRWDLDTEFGVDVRRIDRSGAGWELETSKGSIWTPNVVLATGLYANPEVPDWPGIQGFTRQVTHTRSFRNAKQYAGQKVLVVGGGQSAADIAMESVAEGASKVWLAIRTPPHIAPPDVFGISPSVLAFVMKCFGDSATPAFDRITNLLQRVIRHRYYGDISRYGFGVPRQGLATVMRETGRGILIDRGLITALKAGQIEATPAVVALDCDRVVLADGTTIDPDVVVCGTGARTNLHPLVGHLGVLGADGRPQKFGGAVSPGAPGMYFMGYRLPPGVLPDARRDAPAIARSITGRRARPTLAWRTSRSGYTRPWRPVAADKTQQMVDA